MARVFVYGLVATLLAVAADAARIKLADAVDPAEGHTVGDMETAHHSGGSPWALFKGDPISGTNCNTCAGVPLHELVQQGDEGVGCVHDATKPLPSCPLHEVNDVQAGGHPGTFYKLIGARIAKQTIAFETPSEKFTAAKIDASRTEWEVYMEMWCLKRLDKYEGEISAGISKVIANHPLRPFALGTGGGAQEDPWAPQFYGLCQLEGAEGDAPVKYLVMENVLAAFEKPCQLDLKLGWRTAEPADQLTWKAFRHNVGDMFTPSVSDGARLAGYKVYDPFRGEWKKMESKIFSPTMPLSDVIDYFTDESGHVPTAGLASMRQRLLDMGAWWTETGKEELRAIALSALMIRECGPIVTGSATFSDMMFSSDAMFSSAGKTGYYVAMEGSKGHQGTLYPKVPGEYIEKAEEMGHLAGEFVTNTNPSKNEWYGLQFDLDYTVATGDTITFHVWKDFGSGVYFNKFLGTATVPFADGTQCVPLEACEVCGHEEVIFCVTIKKDWADPQPEPKAKPVVKLIDYAHFYQRSETLTWPEDGVYEGFISAMNQFSRKIETLEAKGVNVTHAYAAEAEIKKKMTLSHEPLKCPRNGEEPTLQEVDCMMLAVTKKKRAMSWKSWKSDETEAHNTGECRLCDELVPAAGGWMRSWSASEWKVYTNNDVTGSE